MAIKPFEKKLPKDSLLILGAGGLGQAVAEIAKISGNFARYAFLDDKMDGDPVLDALDYLNKYKADFTHCIAAFGSNSLRAFYTAKINGRNFLCIPYGEVSTEEADELDWALQVLADHDIEV